MDQTKLTDSLPQARERHPILKKYMHDWATEELVKQYVKNKRKNGYNKGWLEVPEKYAYLKDNSSKRGTAPRKKKGLLALEAAQKAKAASKRKGHGSARKSAGKRRVVAASSEEDDSEHDEQEHGEEEEEEDAE